MKYIKPTWPAPQHIKAFTTSKLGWGAFESRNDQQLINLLSLPHEPIWVNQTHSTIALKAMPSNKDQNADAIFTNETNRVCAVMTADCLPVLICNKQGTHVAAIHAGWRGLAAGIIEKTIEQLQQATEDLLVWLGPAIGPDKFEVGKDVYEAFTNQHPESNAAFRFHQEGKWHADLYALAKIRLQNQGVQDIYGGDFCTYTQSSYQ